MASDRQAQGSRTVLPAPFDRLLLPIYIPSLIISACHTALLILLPIYVVNLGFSAAIAALVVGARGLGLLLFDVPAGLIASRFGDRVILIVGLTVMLGGTLVIGWVASPWLLGFGAFLIGAGFAAWMLGRQLYIADHCEIHETGRAVAAMAGLQRVGFLIGPGVGGVVAEATSYSLTFLSAAALIIVAAGFAISFSRATGEHAIASSLSLGPTFRIMRNHARIFATAGSAALSLQLMRATRMLLIPLFGIQLGLDAAAIGLIYSISAAIDMCLFYPVGVIVDRHGRKWSAVPSLLMFALGLLLLPLATSFWSLLVLACGLGFANGLGTGVVMIIGTDLSRGAEDRSQFLGVWRLIGDVGMSGAPLLSAALVSVASLAAASIVVAVLGFGGAVIMLALVPETLTRAKAEPAELT